MMKISLVLISYNEERYVKRFFDAMSKQTRPVDEIILVDSSTDRTPELAKPYINKLIRTPPRGMGDARRVGIKYATGDMIVFTDIDAIPYPDWIEQFEKCFEAGAKVCVGYNISGWEPDLDPIKIMKTPFGGRYYLHFACSAFAREVFDNFKIDPANTFMDDVTFGYDISKKYRIIPCPKAKVFHGDRAEHYGGLKTVHWKKRKAFGVGWFRLFLHYKFHPFWVIRFFYNIVWMAIYSEHGITRAWNNFAGLIWGMIFFKRYEFEEMKKETSDGVWENVYDYNSMKDG